MKSECCDKCKNSNITEVSPWRCMRELCECHFLRKERLEKDITSLKDFDDWLEHENEDTGGEVGQIDIIEKVEELLASQREAIAKEIEVRQTKYSGNDGNNWRTGYVDALADAAEIVRKFKR